MAVPQIAPITGARIETRWRRWPRTTAWAIAPITGARIETRRWRRGLTLSESPPSRGRGLKPLRDLFKDDGEVIAPITGARIETILFSNSQSPTPNRPHHGGAD